MARLRHSRLRTAFADALQTRRVNLVGYYNVDVKAGKYSMIALNIDPMNQEKAATLDELFPFNDKMAKSSSAGAADRIQTWDYEKQTYRNYFMYYSSTKTGVDPKSYHWVENLPSEGYPLASEGLKTGDCVFYYALNNANTFSLPGQVPNEAAGVLKQGYNMIGVGFPSQWCPNDAGTDFWKDNTKFAMGSSAGAADRIQYWDEAGQTYRYFFLFYSTTKTGVDPKSYQWVENLPGDGYPVLNEKLDTGAGFFYYRQKAGEIEFKPGLKL